MKSTPMKITSMKISKAKNAVFLLFCALALNACGDREAEQRAAEQAQAAAQEDAAAALAREYENAVTGQNWDMARVGLFDAAGVRFKDNRFGIEVLAGKNPFGVEDEASLKRYLDTVFHLDAAKPSIPWPASRVVIGWRKQQAQFEQSVLDRIGRSDERFLPGEAAAYIRQPALLLWCRQDAVIDFSAMDLYAAQMPQAAKVLLDGCGHMSIVEKPDEVAAAVEYLINKGAPR